MRNTRLWFALIFFVAIFVLASKNQTIAGTELQELQKASLKDLKGVYVEVVIADELAKAVPSQHDIQTAVELKLRMVGLQVLTEQKALNTLGCPTLSIGLDGMIIPSCDAYAIHLTVKLYQFVYLARNKAILLFTDTWADSRSGYIGIDRISDIQNLINPAVDEFINDYLSVNPKK
jgi:hypothetical protein